MSTIGELAVWAALLLSAWGATAGWIAARGGDGRAPFGASAARAVDATAVLLPLAVAGVAALLFRSDFSFAFTAEATSANLPRISRVAALLSRSGGTWLVVAGLVALLGGLAVRRAAGSAPLAAAVSALTLLPLAWAMSADSPYARTAAAVHDGAGLAPAWQLPWTSMARASLVLFAAAAAIVLAQLIAARPARRWALAAWAAGAVALVVALHRTIDGPAWGAADWIALAAWGVLSLALHRRRAPARAAAHLAHAAAIVALIALGGWMMRTRQTLPLGGTAPASARDPFGTTWRFTSDGLSVYQELNRHVTAILVDAKRGGARARVARTEWRDYLDIDGAPLGDGTPVDAVLPGEAMYAAVGLAMPPAGEDAVLDVRFVPLFAFWWVALAFALAAAAVAARGEEPA